MNDKIYLLIRYIEERFPEGCGDECDSDCPLYRELGESLKYDLCLLLSNQEHRCRIGE